MPSESSSKVYILELELGELKEIKAKQEAVEQELFKQISEYREENESIMRVIGSKDKKIS